MLVVFNCVIPQGRIVSLASSSDKVTTICLFCIISSIGVRGQYAGKSYKKLPSPQK